MKNILIAAAIIFFVQGFLISQTITGKLIDQNGESQAGAQLKLYIFPKVYSTVSAGDGTFLFDNVTDVKNEQLPNGYSVSNNYPNPFNPRTRIWFTLPNSGNVRVELYNTIGQKVRTDLLRNYSAGNNYIDLELNGLSNGVYLAKINLDDKFSTIKKLMLVYGSQHLSASGGYYGSQNIKSINKPGSAAETKIDSLVVSGSSLYSKTFKNLSAMQGNSLNLGNLRVITPCPGIPSVDYAGKTYNTVKIGTQCWLKENLDIGKWVPMSQDGTYNGIIEKHCYNDDSMNCVKYGGLYTWNEAMQNGYGTMIELNSQGICPYGWHVAGYGDFDILSNFSNSDGNRLKREDQGIGNGIGTNETGFSMLLLKYLTEKPGMKTSLWASFGETTHAADDFGLIDTNNQIIRGISYDFTSNFVRCIKDNYPLPSVPVLEYPDDKAVNIVNPVVIRWDLVKEPAGYFLQVATDSLFSNLVFSKNGIFLYWLRLSLESSTTYYWHVRSENSTGVSAFSEVRSFTTSP